VYVGVRERDSDVSSYSLMGNALTVAHDSMRMSLTHGHFSMVSRLASVRRQNGRVPFDTTKRIVHYIQDRLVSNSNSIRQELMGNKLKIKRRWAKDLVPSDLVNIHCKPSFR